MKWFDLTHPIDAHGSVYPGKKNVSCVHSAYYENGFCVMDMEMSLGSGTHMDAPAHFDRDGETIDQLLIERWIGPLNVMHLGDRMAGDVDYEVSLEDVHQWEERFGKIEKGSFLIGDFSWSKRWGDESFFNRDDAGFLHYPGFSKGCAEYFLEIGIAGLGVDTTSPDVGKNLEFPVHRTLLPNGILIIENLTELASLPEKGALFYAPPMKVSKAPEAPIRAFACLEES